MQGLARQLLVLELLICFLPCTLMLLVGAVMLPMQVAFLFQDSLHWEGGVLILLAVPSGIIGLCALFFVVSSLFAGRERFENPVPVLGGVLIGAAPLLLQLVLALFQAGDVEWGLWFALVLAPLVATVHVLTLTRHMFIAGFRSGKRPLIGPGTWTAVTFLACLAVFLLVLRQGTSHSELADRRAYWMQHRPAAYSYDISGGGWLKPMDRLSPRRIRVVGSELVGASYTFSRGPGDTTEYPPPSESAWTIDDIFDALLDEKKQGSRVTARFDESTGAVLTARIESDDPDGSWSVEVRSLQPLDAAKAREPMPMFISHQR